MTFQVFVTWQCRHSKRHWFSIFVLKNAQHDTRKKRHRPMIKFDECLLACRPTAPTPAMEEEPDLVMSSGTNRRPWTGFVMFLISRGTSESLRSNRFSLGPLYKFCVVGWGLLHDGTVECVALSLESLRSNRFFSRTFLQIFCSSLRVITWWNCSMQCVWLYFYLWIAVTFSVLQIFNAPKFEQLLNQINF